MAVEDPTNGIISDPVVNAITQRNLTWAKRDYGLLVLIQRDELVARFQDAYGKYFPLQPVDIKSFLELYTADGRASLEKENFAGFVEGLLEIVEGKPSHLDVRRATASSVLFTNYALQKPRNRTQSLGAFRKLGYHWGGYPRVSGQKQVARCFKNRSIAMHIAAKSPHDRCQSRRDQFAGRV